MLPSLFKKINDSTASEWESSRGTKVRKRSQSDQGALKVLPLCPFPMRVNWWYFRNAKCFFFFTISNHIFIYDIVPQRKREETN